MLILLIVLFIILILGIIQFNDYKNRVLFQPRKIMNEKFSDMREEYIDGINIWHYNGSHDKTVLFCHGSSGNISQRDYIYNFCKLFKLNLILFDYYGYGRSSKKPSQNNLYKSADVIIDYCQKHCNITNQLIIWGESLGGTVAGYLATKYNCYRLILMSTFSSLDDILIYSKNRNLINKIITFSIKRLCVTFPTKQFMKTLTCPVLIIHSIDDELIPIENPEILFCSIPHTNKQIITIRGSHTSPIFTIGQLIKLLDFCGIDYSKISEKEFEDIIHDIMTAAKRNFNST
jgi:esterase/lipase